MNAEMKNQTKVTNDRITKLEQWKWSQGSIVGTYGTNEALNGP